MSTIESDFSRREFLKLGLAGTALLATAGLGASLSGCGERRQATAQGFRFLRDADVALFAAVIPAVVGDLPAGPPVIAEGLRIIDEQLVRAAATSQAKLYSLFDLLHFAPVRRFAAGVRGPWSEADPQEVTAFLDRWRVSSVGLFAVAYIVLTRLASVAYFGQPAGYQAAGYRPLPRVFDVVNA